MSGDARGVSLTGGRRGVGARRAHLGPLVLALARRDLKTRYRQSALDVAWGFITPVVVMLVYGVVLKGAFDVSGDDLPYLSFAWTGVVAWSFFASGISQGVPSLISAADLISKVYFPRESVPLATVVAALPDLAIASATVLVVAALQGVAPGAHAVLAIVPLALLIIWTAALAVLGAVLTVFVRDVNHGAQLALRVGFFATPVMYPISQLPDGLQWLGVVNPVGVAIEALRDTVLRNTSPDWSLLAIQGVVGTVLLVASIAYARSVEDRMVDVI